MYKDLGISEYIYNLTLECEKEIAPLFSKSDEVCFNNSMRVLNSFMNRNVSSMHLNGTNGYGFNDLGREVVEKVFSDVLGAEDALVRSQFISGTHALSVCLFALLRPGDVMLSITGTPYDTLLEVIGIRENSSSLASYGIGYEEVGLKDGDFDVDGILLALNNPKVKLIEIQRSKGYSLRESISISSILEIVKEIKKVRSDVIIMVDNCYCEFVEEKSPLEVGADIIAGSLIKNLGGGIAPTGGYIAGRSDLIKLCAERLLIPGEGKEVGASLDINRYFLQGLYMAPSVVNSSIKTAILTSRLLEKLGFEVFPKYDEDRVDVVQAIKFDSATLLECYCKGIQSSSAVDSYLTPVADDMPGYDNKIIMAAGNFIQGSTIELSCDGPLREPFVAYQQGGLTYEYGRIGVMRAVTKLLEEK